MIESIVNDLQAQGFDVVSSTEKSIRTRHIVDGEEIVVEGELGDSFPFDAPSFYLLNRAQYGLLGHVGWPGADNDRGLICDGRSDGLSLNYENQSMVFISRLKHAVKTVSSVLCDPSLNERECRREFLGHWNYWVKLSRSLVFIGNSDSFFEKLSFRQPRQKASTPLDKKMIAFEAGYGGLLKANAVVKSITARGATEHGKAYKLRLPSLPLPPSPEESVGAWLVNIFKSQKEVVQKKMKKLSRHNKSKEAYIVFEAEHEGQVARFALKCMAHKKECIPLHQSYIAAWSYEPIRLESYTRDYLLPRGGSSLNLHSKKVVLVGCGSIGCIIADQMASAGIGQVTLCDYDKFCLDNLYRHSLSMSFDGYTKSSSLQALLEEKYPFLVCRNSSDRLLDIDEELLQKADLIIVAIGLTTHEVVFNKRLLASTIKTPIVNTWLEPYGIGGHATLTANADGKGCYGCTFVRSDDPSELQLLSNMNFIAENQRVAKDLGTCGSFYLPYSQIHAAQTATMASKLALRSLSGEIKQSTKVSWSCGYENKPAELSKTRHTQRFANFKKSLEELPLHSPQCPYCND